MGVAAPTHGQPQRLRDRLGAPAGNEGDPHGGFDQHRAVARDLLLQQDRSALYLLRRGDDLQKVAETRRLEEIDMHRADNERKTGRLVFSLFEQRPLIGAEQAQIIGAAALHESQITRVIDAAGKIRVLVIDPHRQDVTSAADLAGDGVLHRHGTSFCIDSSQFLPSNGFGLIALMSKPSRQRALTSILSGSERGT